jgi:hypothetical protein
MRSLGGGGRGAASGGVGKGPNAQAAGWVRGLASGSLPPVAPLRPPALPLPLPPTQRPRWTAGTAGAVMAPQLLVPGSGGTPWAAQWRVGFAALRGLPGLRTVGDAVQLRHDLVSRLPIVLRGAGLQGPARAVLGRALQQLLTLIGLAQALVMALPAAWVAAAAAAPAQPTSDAAVRHIVACLGWTPAACVGLQQRPIALTSPALTVRSATALQTAAARGA